MPDTVEATSRRPPAPVFITGMHRSGTSCLAGALQFGGVYLGAVHTRNPHNARGNREHPAVMALNDALLSTQSACWDRPPQAPSTAWPESVINECARFVSDLEQQSNGRPFGCKDPRFLFTLPAWLQVCSESDAQVVASVRHPWAVANSLHARNGMPLDAGLSLWHQYNRQLLRLLDTRPVCLVNYDAPRDTYIQQLAIALEGLGLPERAADRAAEFIDDTLRHQPRAFVEGLPKEVSDLYAALKDRTCC